VLPTPGEAHAKLARRLEKGAASRLAEIKQPPKKTNAEGMAWLAAGLHCSANERRADEASRDVEAWLKCKYMKEHLGEEYGGVVTAATSFGVFVTLDAMYVEGLVHITELGGEYFRFDEARQELRGERTGTRYAIGTRVRIQVSRVDLDGRKIDFRLVHEGDALVSRAMQDKVAGRDSKLRATQGDRFDVEAGVRPVSFKTTVGKRTAGKPARQSKQVEKSTASQKKAPRKRR
jgi:ribonuclease R